MSGVWNITDNSVSRGMSAEDYFTNIKFIIEPYVRFKGESGEQATMFFMDPENNALEFKAFKNIDQLFEK